MPNDMEYDERRDGDSNEPTSEMWNRLKKQIQEHVADAIARGVTINDLVMPDQDPDDQKDDFNQQF